MKQSSNSSSKRARSQLEYPFATAPLSGQAMEITPGILWARLPLTALSSQVNVWAIADGGGWAVVDTGLLSAETEASWLQIFATAFAGRPVTRVLVTHWHPDHSGMAGWMTRKFACRLWMTRLEYLSNRVMSTDLVSKLWLEALAFYRAAGWDDKAIEAYDSRLGNDGKNIFSLAGSYRRMSDGESFAIGEHQWRVVVGSGHSPEHACLYCPELRLLISGDQALPETPSNIIVYPSEPDADPVADWLDSLAKLKREVPDDVLVLPAHQQPYRGLHARLDELARDRESMLQKLRLAVAEPRRCVDLLETLFGSKIHTNPILFSWATGETIACLNHLLRRGEIARRADAEDVLWYALLSA